MDDARANAVLDQLNALREWIKSYRCECEIDPTTGLRVEQIPCARCNSLASLEEAIKGFEDMVNGFESMLKTLMDVSRYLGNKPFRSDGEELILSRCIESVRKAEVKE